MIVHRRKQFVIFDQALFGAPLHMASKQVQRIAGFCFSPICQTDRFCCCGLTQPENFSDSAYYLPFSSPLPLGYYVCEHDADSLNHRIDKQGRLSCGTERSAQES